MSDDNISLVDHDETWAQQAGKEIASIKLLLPAELVIRIEHTGSTSIPGIKAKPILDIIIQVHSLQDVQVAIEPIKSLGYQFWEDNPDQAKMFFVKGMPPYGTGRTHHILIVGANDLELENRVLFRNYLRAHLDSAKEYEFLKLDLAQRFSNDREAYTNAKSQFVSEIINKARVQK